MRHRGDAVDGMLSRIASKRWSADDEWISSDDRSAADDGGLQRTRGCANEWSAVGDAFGCAKGLCEGRGCRGDGDAHEWDVAYRRRGGAGARECGVARRCAGRGGAED